MSLIDFKKNLIKIKELSGDYDRIKNDKAKIELDIRNLKAKYQENKVEREVFGEYNKRLEGVNKELGELKEKVLKFCNKNSEIISEELKNDFG
jgi:hemerythrin-like domain-containing protein